MRIAGTDFLATLSSLLESTVTKAWQRRGALALCLWPLSLLFGFISALRRALYRAGLLQVVRLPVPVVIVGNIFIGGTGKTPLVIWLVAALRSAGYRPGVISRGFGASAEEVTEVTSLSRAQHIGDEPLLLAQRTGCPVVVGRDRVAAARALLSAHPSVDVILSDDGLQHYRLGRTVEIVLFDSRGVGNGWLLPAGPLREPITRRRDITVVNAATPPSGMPATALRMTLVGAWAQALADSTHRQPLASLSGRILAVAGIGNPERYFAMLRDHGLDIETLALPDHYDFSVNPFLTAEADIILVTEKDAVKCRQIEVINRDSRLWVVPVAAHIDGPLADILVEKLRGHPIA